MRTHITISILFVAILALAIGVSTTASAREGALVRQVTKLVGGKAPKKSALKKSTSPASKKVKRGIRWADDEGGVLEQVRVFSKEADEAVSTTSHDAVVSAASALESKAPTSTAATSGKLTEAEAKAKVAAFVQARRAAKAQAAAKTQAAKALKANDAAKARIIADLKQQKRKIKQLKRKLKKKNRPKAKWRRQLRKRIAAFRVLKKKLSADDAESLSSMPLPKQKKARPATAPAKVRSAQKEQHQARSTISPRKKLQRQRVVDGQAVDINDGLPAVLLSR